MKISKKLSFSDRIIRRNRIMIGVLVLMLIYMVVVGELHLGDSRMMSELAEVTARIIFFGGMIYLFVKIIKNKKLLANRQLLKQELLREKDEMERAVYEKTGGICWDILFICQLFITLTTALVDMKAFYTAFASLAVLVCVKVALVLFARKAGVE